MMNTYVRGFLVWLGGLPVVAAIGWLDAESPGGASIRVGLMSWTFIMAVMAVIQFVADKRGY